MARQWFDVDKAGLGKQAEQQGKGRLVGDSHGTRVVCGTTKHTVHESVNQIRQLIAAA
jgi:hypothetical protein